MGPILRYGSSFSGLTKGGCRIQTEQKTGVILKNKVDIKSDRCIQDITLFQLHEGAIVSVNQEEGNWVHVSLDKDKSGWIPKKSVGY